MAKRVEEAEVETEAKEVRLITEGAFKKLMKDIKAGEGKMNEGKGDIGSAIENAIAKHNVHKDALRIIRKYEKKGAAAQAEFLMQFDHMWQLAKLAEPKDDMLETPADRGANVRELGRPTHAIKGGKVEVVEEAEVA